MNILYAIQGTGNGHLTRAMEIVPHLKRKGNVDVLISGIQYDLQLPFHVKYRFHGLSFIFGKKGGVDVWNTYLKMNSLGLLREIKNLPIEDYDLVISDFEPVSCWAAYLKKKTVVGLSNQVATLHPLAPRPDKSDLVGKLVLENYAPSNVNYGFHYRSFADNIFTPIVRKQVRELDVKDKGHYTVYLPSYDDERIVKHLKRFKDVQWQVFSKHNKQAFKLRHITVQPLNGEAFLKSMATSRGVLCNAGFGTTSEALYLSKKLLVVPMKTQYEQHCNVAMLDTMGVPAVKSLKKKHTEGIERWLNDGTTVKVNYPDQTADIVDTVVATKLEKAA